MDRQYFKMNISPAHTFHNTVDHTLSIIAETMGTTFGPYGGHNLFKNGPEVNASKDGLENLSMMNLDGSIPSSVYQMALEVASNQASVVGDGTTSAVLIMAAVYKKLRSNKDIWNKYTPSEIHRAMGHIQEELIRVLSDNANQLNTDESVLALIRTSVDANDDLTQLLYGLYKDVSNIGGKNIVIDYAGTERSYYRTINGINIAGKLMNPAFSNQDIDTCVLRNAEVIIVDGKANINNDVLKYVNKLKTHNKSLAIICSGVNENFYRYIELMAQNQPEVLANFCVIYSNANTIQDKDTFYDILKITNSVYFPENTEITSEFLEATTKGVAENVMVKDSKITLAGFVESDELIQYMNGLKAKIDELQEELNSEVLLSTEDRTSIQVQLSKITNRYYRMKDGATTIYVGGDTPQRKSINYRLVEDGLKALQSGINYGYFLGCNTVVPNILLNMLNEQKDIDDRSDNGPSVYYLLAESLLNAYLDVYKRLVLNRAVLTNDEVMEVILGDKFEEMYNPETGYIHIKRPEGNPVVFYPVDLRGQDGQQVINPARTDINIVSRSIDAALVLATSNTIITDQVEFEGRVD